MPSKPKRNTSLAASFLNEIEGVPQTPKQKLAVTPLTTSSQRKKHAAAKEKREKQSRYVTLLKNEEFHKFSPKDWITYYSERFHETFGSKYLSSGVKDSAIMKSLLANLDWEDVKLMIDFVFDCDHDLFNTRQLGIFAFSKGWLNQTYQSAQEWQAGTYVKKSDLRKLPRRNREWNVASPKVEVTHGEPNRDVVIDW